MGFKRLQRDMAITFRFRGDGFVRMALTERTRLAYGFSRESVRDIALLLLAIWAFCRLYYFCFYVIEKYIDADFKFAGLWSVWVYLWRKRS